MHCLGKEYRVVCLQTSDKKTIIDIVPADNALHRLILQERLQRDSGTEIIAGSVVLYDMGEDNKPEILFLPPENGGLPEVELSSAQENCLRHKISARFAEMMEQNLQSTLTVRPEIHREYVMNIISGINDALESSLGTTAAPQSPQEEQNRLLAERRRNARRTRTQTEAYLMRRDAKFSKYGLTALQINQLLHRDY